MGNFKDNLIKKIGKENFAKVQAAKIGIAGAGGLGSNCAVNLVRVGFRKIIIADFDKVSEENLDRQFYFLDQVGLEKTKALKDNLLKINPDLELVMINKKIENDDAPKIFKDCDIVIECLDRADYKSMLVSELLGLNKFIIAVSGLGGVGSSDEIKINRIKNNLVVIGDLKSDVNLKPALSPRVNIAAAKQADLALEYIILKS